MDKNLEQQITQTYGPHTAPETFSFPVWEQPKVSLIIPVYNKYEMTKECLYSILNHTQGISYEVLIADDCSTDETKNITQYIEGIQHIRTKENMGFGGNVENAVKHAKGTYICLLNNDMLFYDKWLNLIIKELEKNSSIGAAGSTLLAPDGKVSELGGVIFDKNIAIRIGRECLYRRKLKKLNVDYDYKSGCCLVLKKSLWDKVGGFDAQFRPAYYEDVDLCFKIRQMGLRIVNVFKSKIMHFETVSYGDKEFNVSKLGQKNGELFFKKWRDVLLDSKHTEKTQRIIETYNQYLAKENRPKFFAKEKNPNGRRHIYLCGIKVFSYKKKQKKKQERMLQNDFIVSKGVILKGENTFFKGASIRTQFPQSIIIGKGTRIGQDATISNYEKNGIIQIGENCQIGWNNNYYGQGGIEIGNNVLTASYVCILTSNYGWEDINTPIANQPSTYKNVTIGDDCWIGYNVIILAGVHIGKHVTVGAGSVVTKDLPEYSVCAGNPCRVIKKYNFETNQWEKVK